MEVRPLPRCFKCGHLRLATDPGPDYSCPQCGAVYAKMEGLRLQAERDEAIVASARSTGDWSPVPPQVVQKLLQSITVTTTDNLPARPWSDALGIVAGEYSYAFGAIFEGVAGLLRNIAGSGKSGMTTRMLRDGRLQAVHNMRHEALMLGAQAVVGVRVDFEEFSGSNGLGVIVVVATGTAVRLDQPT